MDNFSILVNRYLREFRKIKKGQQVIIIAVLAGIFTFGFLLPFGINKFSTYKPSKPLPLPTPIPIPAEISLNADKKVLTSGATFSAIININSPNQGVEAADIVVDFDPNYLSVATVSAGNYFGQYPVKETGSGFVKISGIANLVNNKFIIPIGKGTIGSIIFETLSATGNTKISFDREKTIVAAGGKNILDQSKITDLQVIIK